MFDFRKRVRRHSLDIPLHDEFNARTYVLGDNDDILVTIGAGVQIAGLSHSLTAQSVHEIVPELTGHRLPLGECEAYNRGRCKSRSDQAAVHDRDCL
jgi:hypothetical protein